MPQGRCLWCAQRGGVKEEVAASRWCGAAETRSVEGGRRRLGAVWQNQLALEEEEKAGVRRRWHHRWLGVGCHRVEWYAWCHNSQLRESRPS